MRGTTGDKSLKALSATTILLLLRFLTQQACVDIPIEEKHTIAIWPISPLTDESKPNGIVESNTNRDGNLVDPSLEPLMDGFVSRQRTARKVGLESKTWI